MGPGEAYHGKTEQKTPGDSDLPQADGKSGRQGSEQIKRSTVERPRDLFML